MLFLPSRRVSLPVKSARSSLGGGGGVHLVAVIRLEKAARPPHPAHRTLPQVRLAPHMQSVLTCPPSSTSSASPTSFGFRREARLRSLILSLLHSASLYLRPRTAPRSLPLVLRLLRLLDLPRDFPLPFPPSSVSDFIPLTADPLRSPPLPEAVATSSSTRSAAVSEGLFFALAAAIKRPKPEASFEFLHPSDSLSVLLRPIFTFSLFPQLIPAKIE